MISVWMAVAGDDLMVTAPAYEPARRSRSLLRGTFTIEEVLTWKSTQSQVSLSDEEAWSSAPEGSNKGLLALLLEDPRFIFFDVETWSGSTKTHRSDWI